MIPSGTKLGPYEVAGPLGAGGMGEVYRARDTRLERTVAIKILPKEMSADAVHRQRFEREAKTISSLNHPHICVLHDIGSQDGVDYLVMECVEGETLAKRLEKGPLPLEQILKYGAQIADALDKAHRAGIVHRDLKPGNIMLTAGGAKLLDFGLAKPAAPLASGLTLTAAAAPSTPVTQAGMIVGTFQYMSPEQVEGKELDGRSDIFSLGAVLYETLTGQHAFPGKSQLSVASAILEKEPAALTTIKPMTPPALEHAIKKCLAKNPDERWQSASDLASELKWVAESGGHPVGVAAAAVSGKTRERLAWVLACTLGIALIVSAVWWRNPRLPVPTLYFSASLPFPANDVAIAPNGHTLALVAYKDSARKNVLWIYELGSQSARNLSDTEGATYPFWSPDGQSLAFFADGKLRKLEIATGQVQTLCDAPSGRGGTWNKDGVIVFTPDGSLGGGLFRVPAAGGTPMQISAPDKSLGEQSHRWPMFLPDGTHYLYLAANFAGRKSAIYVGSLGSAEKHLVVEATANAAYAAPGYLLFCRDNDLLAQRFHPQSFSLTGQPATILTEIRYQPQVKRAVFAANAEGFLVSQIGNGVALSQPVWFDRKGNELGVVGKPYVYGNVSIAPNGTSVALSQTDTASPNQNSEVWTYELIRQSAKRLTFDASNNAVPIWSPDGSRLIFASSRAVNFDLYMKNSDGAQEEKPVLQDDNNKLPSDWSRDGRFVLYTRGTDLWSMILPAQKTSLFLKAPSALKNAQFSPDGKWVAYASNETGKWQIYVTSFPEARGKWQVSTAGGEQPRWRGDGKELFYLSSDYKMMAAPVTSGTNFDSGAPIALFQTSPRPPVSLNDIFVYDVSRDGQRFLINTPVKQPETTAPMTVVLNWSAKLDK